MLEQVANTVTFATFYTESKVGKTGLTVTVDVYNPARSLIVSGAAATAIGGGLYYYDLVGASTGSVGEYYAIFKTATTTVDQQHIPALWVIGRAGIEHLDSSIAGVAAAVWAAGTRTLSSFGTLVADIWAAVTRSLTDKAGFSLATAPPTAAEIDAQLIASHGAGAWTSGAAGATAAEVWGYSTRTLTQSAAQVAAAVAGSSITIRRGDSLSASLTDIGSLVGATKVWWTVKAKHGDSDAQALLQVIAGTGLVRLNGAAATAGQGSLTIDDAATGDATIALAAAATATLPIRGGYHYDIQILTAAGVTTRTEGYVNVVGDVTRATS